MIEYSDKKLWGVSGGQLEYVSQRIENRLIDKKWHQVVVIRFTDHDVQNFDDDTLVDGKYYELEFPLYGS